MPSDMNVRSLISKFEQLTTEIKKTNFKSTEDLLEPRTPKTTTKFVYTPGQKSSYARLSDIEQNIESIQEQVVNLDEGLTNEEFIRILFALLNLLIDLGSIDTDGVQNLKQKKALCFKGITDCKEELVKCMGEQFEDTQKPEVAISNGEDIERSKEDVKRSEEDVELSEEEVAESQPQMFVSVAKLKSIWEKSSEDLDVTYRSARFSSTDSEAETVVRGNSDTALRCSNSDFSENVEHEVSEEPLTITTKNDDSDDEDDYQSLESIELKSVKAMRSIFEGQTSSKKVDDVLERHKLMDTLLEEIEYYAQIQSSDSIAENEVVEENLVGLYIELNKFDTLQDHGLEERRSKAIETVNSLQAKIDERKTNVGLYIENLIDDDDSVHKLNELCVEVDRYKELVDDLGCKDRVFIEVLEQNIHEVLEQLDKLTIGADLGYKKIRAIRDLSALLNNVEAALENHSCELLAIAQEKVIVYRRLVEELDSTDKDAAQALSDDIQVDLDKLRASQVAPEDEVKKSEVDKSLCEILFDLHKKQAGPYFAICPPYVPSSEPDVKDQQDLIKLDELHEEKDVATSNEKHGHLIHQEEISVYVNGNVETSNGQENKEQTILYNTPKIGVDDKPSDLGLEENILKHVTLEVGMSMDQEQNNLNHDEDAPKDVSNDVGESKDQNNSDHEENVTKNGIEDKLIHNEDNPKDLPTIEATNEPDAQIEDNKIIDTTFDQLYDELTVSNGTDTKTVQTFDDLLKHEDAEESARIFDASASLDDIALKVAAYQKIVETLSILGADDTEKFRQNIEDVRTALAAQDTLGDATLELKRATIMGNVRVIEEKFEIATNEVD